MTKKSRRFPPEINAGTMADIAFLLLIFFLVTTTIAEDKGILVKLPPWQDIIDPPAPIPNRNLLAVNINAQGKLLVESKETDISSFREIVKEFITNPQTRSDLPVNPNRAVVSLRNDRGTPYEAYLSVYDELKAAYSEVWEAGSQKQFNKTYTELTNIEQREIRRQWPQIISEAELTDYVSK